MTPSIGAPHTLTPFRPEPGLLQESKIVGFNSRDIKSRYFNLLRTQVLKRTQEKRWKLIGITSPAPGAGKSFVAANLAASISRIPDRKTYLFDLDLRRSAQAQNFGLPGEKGISDYLEGTVTRLSDIALHVEDTNLAIYPSYGHNFGSFELLASERFSALVAAMRALPDDAIVICDLPPTFANDDAMMVGQKLDAYIMVIEQGVTNKSHALDCKRLMEPTPCLGTVLNRYEGGFSDPYGYGYGYGYDKKYSGYYEEQSSR